MYITPFMKQCFVTLGASINQAIIAMVPSYTARLLPQLRRDDSTIPIDDNSASWIASIHGFSLFVGNLCLPLIMGLYGRKPASLVSITTSLIGWVCIGLSDNITLILVGKLFHGFSMGMVNSLPSIVIAEYTSPKNRALLTSMTLIQISLMTMLVHTAGSYLGWKFTALICILITFLGIIIIIMTPESPSWLADKGRYEDSKRVFFWLREKDEANEIENTISATRKRRNKRKSTSTKDFLNETKTKFFKNLNAIKLRECYLPVLIMIHVYTFTHWCASNPVINYMQDIFSTLTSPDTDINLQIMFTDILGLCYNIIAVFVMRKCKRRFILCTFLSLNIFVLLTTALYSYCKAYNMLPFDHPIIGILLIHLLLFSFLVGIFPLSITIDGEIFSLEYRSFSAGITTLYFTVAISASIKSFPYLKNSIGLHGAYLMYAGISSYCLAFLLKFMPETKNMTLIDIENKFQNGNTKVTSNDDSYLVRPLTLQDLNTVK
ncbi:proton myo-inositol cotransporter-like [Achroia grisella]|uniref:proton myo-inositol cotransporter-like n=1 Tax=Achroia grisella TaxID=688607 RepID=UPI0027D2735E|nr:proton myo-inositol cotransporter-like [Achroia grisella]